MENEEQLDSTQIALPGGNMTSMTQDEADTKISEIQHQQIVKLLYKRRMQTNGNTYMSNKTL